MPEKPNKLFISHSSKDKEYLEALVDLLERIGMPADDIVCTSVTGCRIPNDENIYDWLRAQFTDCNLRVLYVLSKNYYDSPACLNEMGAAWVTKKTETIMLLPDFDYGDIKGCVDPRKIGIKLDGDEEELRNRLDELKDALKTEYDLKINGARWESHRQNFIKKVRVIAEARAKDTPQTEPDLPAAPSRRSAAELGFVYSILSSNHIAITKYRGESGSLLIPERLDEYIVVAIADSAFEECVSLISVTISNSVRSIGNSAFLGCSSLTSVTIPNSVRSVGDSAFYGCSSLTDVTISKSVTSIEREAFSGCSNLTSVTIPNSVTSIGDQAFSECSSLTSVTIPNSVTSIGKNAFDGCLNLTNLTIPNSVTSIGHFAFASCRSLPQVTIPNSITSFGHAAFAGCYSLTVATIQNGVTSIGEDAFIFCKNLKEIKVSIENRVYSSLNGVLFNADKTELICCPEGKTGSYIIPDSVTRIGDKAFQLCRSLTRVTIPDSVTSIGYCAFCGCSGLTSVSIPPRVMSIGYRAFCGCSSLTSVTIPTSVTSVQNEAFSGCSSLSNVTIPNNVWIIADTAFQGCDNLTIYCRKDSYAYRYAVEHHIPCQIID